MNKKFMTGGIKTLFRKNWGIDIDETEIDGSLSYAENVTILYERFVLLELDEYDLR